MKTKNIANDERTNTLKEYGSGKFEIGAKKSGILTPRYAYHELIA
jgi:hypothetical protein